MIRDYLGKPLKEGDFVIFNNNGYFQKAELLEFYHCIPHNVGRYGLSYDEIRIIDSKLSGDENERKYDIFANIAWDGEYDTDHYGKPIEGTFKYKHKFSIRPCQIIKVEKA